MTSKYIRTIIIDDDRDWHNILEKLIEVHPKLEWAGSFSSPIEAHEFLSQGNVDLVFLDIEMPNFNGIEFIERMINPPSTIFITAFPEFAAKSYEVNAVDYLIKPFSTPRFLQAIEKVILKQNHSANSHSLIDNEFFFIRENNQFIKIDIDKVLFLKSMENYTQIITSDNTYTVLMSLTNVEEQLPPSVFRRVHRSYIANISKITSVTKSDLAVGQYKIPLTRTFVDDILNNLVKKRLITKAS